MRATLVLRIASGAVLALASLGLPASAGAAAARLPLAEVETLLREAATLAEAERARDALDVLAEAQGGLPALPDAAALHGRIAAWRGTLLLRAGRHAEAEAALHEALRATRVAHGDGGVELAGVQAALAEAARRRDRTDEAVAWLEAAQTSLAAVPPGTAAELEVRIANALGVLRWRQGALEAGAEALAQAAARGDAAEHAVVLENHAAALAALAQREGPATAR